MSVHEGVPSVVEMCGGPPRTFSRDAESISSPLFSDRGRQALHQSPYPAMAFQSTVVGLHRPEFIGQHDSSRRSTHGSTAATPGSPSRTNLDLGSSQPESSTPDPPAASGAGFSPTGHPRTLPSLTPTGKVLAGASRDVTTHG